MEDKQAKPAESSEPITSAPSVAPAPETASAPTSDTPASPAASVAAPATAPARRKNHLFTAIAAGLVLVALVAVWFRLEQEGRVNTTFFAGIMAAQQNNAVVATVNDQTLRGEDLALSLEQLEQAALAQGLDPAIPQVQADIRQQAIDMLVNTTLLEQAAADQGIVISDEAVAERIAELEFQAGGKEVLAARMESFDIDQETFEADVRLELTIVTLLDGVFATADVAVTEEEILAVYEQAGGGAADVPALEEVRPQLEAQLQQAKEQAAVDDYLAELRAAADIEITP